MWSQQFIPLPFRGEGAERSEGGRGECEAQPLLPSPQPSPLKGRGSGGPHFARFAATACFNASYPTAPFNT